GRVRNGDESVTRLEAVCDRDVADARRRADRIRVVRAAAAAGTGEKLRRARPCAAAEVATATGAYEIGSSTAGETTQIATLSRDTAAPGTWNPRRKQRSGTAARARDRTLCHRLGSGRAVAAVSRIVGIGPAHP